jgi:penicillin-binding protein 1A
MAQAPRRGRKKASPRPTLFVPRRLLRYGLLALAAGAGLLALLFVTVYWGWFGNVPSRQELSAIQHHQATEVWSSDGVVLGKYYRENRVIVPIDKVSPWVGRALVATEDARFFEHRGVDLISLGRVVLRTLLAGDRRQGGGSTLSQQLAKNLYPRKSGRFLSLPVSKIREMIVATRLEKAYDKEELLHLYLNTVPFGDNIFGIEVAARRYFSIPAEKLQPHQAATLVGMLKGNTIYHPVRYPERSLERRNLVLERMRERGDLTRAEYTAWKARPLEVRYAPESHHQGLATYFREHLRIEADSLLQRLSREKDKEYNLYTDGLRIHTTLDAGLQRLAEEAMSTHMTALQAAFDKEWKGGKPWGNDAVLEQAMRQSPRWAAAVRAGMDEAAIRRMFGEPVEMNVFTWQGEARRTWTPMDSLRHAISLLHAGILAGEPGSGAIRVWVGGISQRFFQYDQVKARRQAGSVFKPVVYAAALEAGFDPCDYFDNQEITYPEFQGWTPRNADGSTGGVYTLAGALSQSLNTVTAALIMETGVEPVRRLARAMGVTSPLPEVPSLALGVAELSLFDVLSLYGTLANEGVPPRWYHIERIETAGGEVLYRHEEAPRAAPVLDADHVLVLRHALEMAVDSGTARALRGTYGLRGPLAGKTGTTQDQADGWFAGYSSGLVAAARVGATLPSVHFKTLRQGSGSRTAMPLFGRLWAGCQQAPEYRKLVLTSFPPLPDTLRAELDCPPMLPDWPDVADEGGGLLEFLGIRKSQPEDEALDEQTRRSPSAASERIRKENEKRKRKQERKKAWKDFWDGVMGRD